MSLIFEWKFLFNTTYTFESIIPLQEEFEDTKGTIRIRISKDRQHNDKKEVQNDKQRSTKHTYKTKDRVT